MKRLELRKTRTVLGDNKEYYEIVAWYPNPDYNKQDEYIPLGGDVYRSKKYPTLSQYGRILYKSKTLI